MNRKKLLNYSPFNDHISNDDFKMLVVLMYLFISSPTSEDAIFCVSAMKHESCTEECTELPWCTRLLLLVQQNGSDEVIRINCRW